MSARLPFSAGEPHTVTGADDRFYIVMALTMIALNVVGFGPALVDTASRKAPLTLAVGAHGAIFALWPLLFLTQAWLIAAGKRTLHRRLGYAGVLLAMLLVGTGYLTAVGMARRGYDLSGDLNAVADPLFVLVFQLGDLVIFTILLIAALAMRRRRDIHKRLMLFATVGGMMPASLSHIIGHSPLLRQIDAPIILIPFTLLLAANAVHERVFHGRIHPVSLWVPIAVLAWGNLRAVIIGPSDLWHEIAAWLIG